METKLVKKGLQSIYGGLQMLSENKTASLSTIAEISIILSNTEIRDRYQLDDSISDFLSKTLFLIKDLNPDSVKLITEYIANIEQENHSTAANIDYKDKYEQSLEKINFIQSELLDIKYRNISDDNFTEIMSFLNHVFGDKIQIGLDYLQLLLQKPNQKLPVLCLLSEENKTGKSTFCKLLKVIFNSKMATISNDDLENIYNDKWADKTIICCEESFIDKTKTKNKIKKLCTSDKIILNKKFTAEQEIDFNGRFILTSNHTNFLPLKDKDKMFWKVQLNKQKFSKGYSLDNMTNEVPYFIEYLCNRKLDTVNESELWFNPELLLQKA